MAFDHTLDNGQPCTGPLTIGVTGVQTLEHGEDRLGVLWTNANTVIAYVERIGRLASHLDGGGEPADFDPLVRLVVVFDGVEDQIVEDLADPCLIAPDYRQRP